MAQRCEKMQRCQDVSQRCKDCAKVRQRCKDVSQRYAKDTRKDTRKDASQRYALRCRQDFERRSQSIAATLLTSLCVVGDVSDTVFTQW